MADRWVLFDLNGTLLDPATMADAFGDGPADKRLALAAFHDAILAAMAETMTGRFRPLPELLEAALSRRLELDGRDASVIGQAMELAQSMRPFRDAEDAFRRLRNAGLRTGVVTNSQTESARASLAAAQLDQFCDALIGSDEVQAFKPDPRVYRNALARLGAEPRDVWLVAAHWWDLHGAKRAGLRTGWVARDEGILLATAEPPDVRGDDLDGVARAVVEAAAGA